MEIMALTKLVTIVYFISCIVLCAAALENATEINNPDGIEIADLLNETLYANSSPNSIEDVGINTANEFINVTFISNITETTEYDENITETTGIANLTAKSEAQINDDGIINPTGGFSTAASAGILSVVFVLLAATGYGVMIAYRKALQVRYDNSQMLITDDVYDISDLRNFEI